MQNTPHQREVGKLLKYALTSLKMKLKIINNHYVNNYLTFSTFSYMFHTFLRWLYWRVLAT